MADRDSHTPKWDMRFLKLAELVSTWSKDPSTKTGAAIIRFDKTLVSVGFNGFPKRALDKQEFYDNREEKYSRIVHCEMNALIHAGENVTGCTLYTWPCISCDRCVVHMIQAGIHRFVAPAPTADMNSRWEVAFKRTRQYIDEAGLQLFEIPCEWFEEPHS